MNLILNLSLHDIGTVGERRLEDGEAACGDEAACCDEATVEGSVRTVEIVGEVEEEAGEGSNKYYDVARGFHFRITFMLKGRRMTSRGPIPTLSQVEVLCKGINKRC